MKIKYLVAAIIITAFFSAGWFCYKKYMDGEPLRQAVEIVKTMTLEQKVGQMIMSGVPGTEYSEKLDDIIRKYNPGGVILFGFNLSEKEKLAKFINSMQESSMKRSALPLFVSIDQEGGRVKRIRDGVTQFPGAMACGVSGDFEAVYDMARITGIELRMIGVNMNLAPSVDVNNNPDNPVINTRSFGSDPDTVSAVTSRYIKGIQKSYCMAVAKHFPGHGDTNKDSHLTLPVINYDMERLRQVELPPFKKSVDSGVSTVMSAHISYPKITGDNKSATVSRFFMTDLLRAELNFKGLVITDDMEMNAISKKMTIGDGAVDAVIAGADIVLVSTNGRTIDDIHTSLIKALKSGVISKERIDSSVVRIIENKIRYRILAYDKNIRSMAKPGYTESDLTLLSKSGMINSNLSRKAIYFHGNRAVIDKISGKKIAVISVSPVFRDQLEKRKNIELFNSVSEFEKRSQNFDMVYFQTTYDIKGSLFFIDYCKRTRISHSLVVTGNPFPFARTGNITNVIFSFSDTDESIRQAALAAAGDFEPAYSIKFKLGL